MKSNRISKQQANANLMASLSGSRSRRNILKGAVAGVTGIAVGAGALAVLPAHAEVLGADGSAILNKNTGMTYAKKATADTIVSILSVARTAEQLAITFYTNGIANADKLGITGDNLTYLKAALVEEQIHQQFFTAQGGDSLTDTFSFPNGAKTFSDLTTFISTQQQLEGVFDSAFLAAIREFAEMGSHGWRRSRDRSPASSRSIGRSGGTSAGWTRRTTGSTRRCWSPSWRTRRGW